MPSMFGLTQKAISRPPHMGGKRRRRRLEVKGESQEQKFMGAFRLTPLSFKSLSRPPTLPNNTDSIRTLVLLGLG